MPEILSLSFGQPTANLGTFLPGVTADYTATLAATVTTTAPNAALSVRDPSANAPGRLVNGTYVMPQAAAGAVRHGRLRADRCDADAAARLVGPAEPGPGGDRASNSPSRRPTGWPAAPTARR